MVHQDILALHGVLSTFGDVHAIEEVKGKVEMKRIHYCSLRVEENTLRMAKEMAAREGISMKDFIRITLETNKEKNNGKKKQIGFDFRL